MIDTDLFSFLDQALTSLPEIAFIDCSDRNEVEVFGPDATDFLHRISTAPVAQINPGRGTAVLFLNGKGHVVACALGWRRPEGWALDVDPGHGQRLADHLEFFHIRENLEIRVIDQRYHKVLLFGKSVGQVVKDIWPETLPEPATPSHAAPRTGSLQEWTIVSQGHVREAFSARACKTGQGPHHSTEGDRIRLVTQHPVPIYMLLLSPNSATVVKSTLQQVGAQPATSQEFELVRILAGWWRFGCDIDPERLGPEVTDDEAILSLGKGCYPGQEVVARVASRGHVNWHLRGICFPATVTKQPRSPLTFNGGKIGWVTSLTTLPTKGLSVGLGYLRRGYAEDRQILATDDGPLAVFRVPYQPNWQLFDKS